MSYVSQKTAERDVTYMSNTLYSLANEENLLTHFSLMFHFYWFSEAIEMEHWDKMV